MLRTSFLEELLYDDFAASDVPAMAIVCKLSAFLRFLEELLLQCQELAVAEAEFAQVDNDSGDSSDSDQVQSYSFYLDYSYNSLPRQSNNAEADVNRRPGAKVVSIQFRDESFKRAKEVSDSDSDASEPIPSTDKDENTTSGRDTAQDLPVENDYIPIATPARIVEKALETASGKKQVLAIHIDS